MKRAFAAAGAVLAVAIITGALVVVGLIAAWKYVFKREDKLDPDGETMRRIRVQDEQDAFARGMDDARVIPQPPTVLDGPATSALKKPWSASN